MSRYSLGGGMFSPIRCDATDDVFKDQRESDIFSQWKEICVGEILTKNSEDFSNEVSDEKEDNSTFAVKPNDSIFAFKHDKSSTNSDTSKSKLSYITTRRKNSAQNNQNSSEVPPKTSTLLHKEVKTNKKKDSLSKYVSVRSELGKGSEFRTSKTRQSNNFYSTPSLPSLTEEQFGMKSLSPDSAFSGGGRSVTSAPSGVQKLSNINNKKDKKQNSAALLKESTSNESEIKNDKFLTIDREVQTDLSMTNLNLKSVKKLEDSASNSESASASNLHISSKPQQIQANIIEKLVKDTISFEFDGIRQMLYLQQLSLFKYMDKNTEIERQNSSLQTKYIEALMEENKRLREEVTAYQNFFKI